jgi:hypothetical protein
MTWKGRERATGTHSLDSAEGSTSQEMERKRASDGHSPPGERRGMDQSGRAKEASKRQALTSWRAQRHRLVRTWKEASKLGELTSWRTQREGLFRTWKRSELARGTHSLESAEGWASQDMERKRASDRHSHPGERR